MFKKYITRPAAQQTKFEQALQTMRMQNGGCVAVDCSFTPMGAGAEVEFCKVTPMFGCTTIP